MNNQGCAVSEEKKSEEKKVIMDTMVKTREVIDNIDEAVCQLSEIVVGTMPIGIEVEKGQTSVKSLSEEIETKSRCILMNLTNIKKEMVG